MRPSLVVGDALPFSSLPTDNGSGSVSSLCSDAAGTSIGLVARGIFIVVWVWVAWQSNAGRISYAALCQTFCTVHGRLCAFGLLWPDYCNKLLHCMSYFLIRVGEPAVNGDTTHTPGLHFL